MSDPTPEERVQLVTVLHPGCLVTGMTVLVLFWGIFGYWLFCKH